MQQALPRTVRRLALLGGESTGKTTLARALAEALHTAWVPEYGRQRWEELRQTLSVAELLAVARRQVVWEEEAAARLRAQGGGAAPAWLICDTTPLTTLQYCLHDHGVAPAELQALALRHYDKVVVCDPDFEFVQDGARRDDAFRNAQQAWTLAQLAWMGVPCIHATGPLDHRVAQVLRDLSAPQPPTLPQ